MRVTELLVIQTDEFFILSTRIYKSVIRFIWKIYFLPFKMFDSIVNFSKKIGIITLGFLYGDFSIAGALC